MRSTTTRALRANLSATMARAAKGEEVVVTHRGQPYVRLLPAAPVAQALRSYPLRGSVVQMAEDFDAPLLEPWTALMDDEDVAPRPRPRSKR